MPFSNAQIREVADYYETRHAAPLFGPLFTACAAGLRAWEARRAYYRRTVDTAGRFLRELEGQVAKIVTGPGLNAETEQEVAYALVECLACIIREVTAGAGAESPDEEAVLSFFEGSGEWRRDDDTLVAEYFFKRIPAEVLCRTASVLDQGLRPASTSENQVPAQ